MADKCVILCADHRCKHTVPNGGYGVCHHPDHENLGAYGGIIRMYMETCPRNEPIPPNMVRGGAMPRVYFGAAGSGKRPLSLFEDPTDLLEQGIVPVTALISGKFEFTEEDVLSAIEQFKSAKPMPESPYPPFTWDNPGFSLRSEEDNHE